PGTTTATSSREQARPSPAQPGPFRSRPRPVAPNQSPGATGMALPKTADPLERYQCGPLRFTDPDLYDRRLIFDHITSADQASPRERFEALAWSVRDLLAQRWLL